MATANALRTEASTVTSSFERGLTGELRVRFVSFTSDADGFCLDELDALQHAITIARRQLLEDAGSSTSELRIFAANDADSQYHEQLSRMAAPT